MVMFLVLSVLETQEDIQKGWRKLLCQTFKVGMHDKLSTILVSADTDNIENDYLSAYTNMVDNLSCIPTLNLWHKSIQFRSIFHLLINCESFPLDEPLNLHAANN